MQFVHTESVTLFPRPFGPASAVRDGLLPLNLEPVTSPHSPLAPRATGTTTSGSWPWPSRWAWADPSGLEGGRLVKRILQGFDKVIKGRDPGRVCGWRRYGRDCHVLAHGGDGSQAIWHPGKRVDAIPRDRNRYQRTESSRMVSRPRSSTRFPLKRTSPSMTDCN